MNFDIPQDKTTALELIRFPTPLRGSITRKRVKSSRWVRVNEDNFNPQFFYVRMCVGGVYRTLGCTTDEAKACRFADMACCRFAKQTSGKRKGSDDLNYSLEQVALDEQIPEARALLDELEELYKVEKKITLEQRVTDLEEQLATISVRVLALDKLVGDLRLAPLDYTSLLTSQASPPQAASQNAAGLVFLSDTRGVVELP
jgi:hypothetical protein